jgi:hypothetical protein
VITFWRWRTPGGSLLLLWTFGTVMGMSLWMNGANSARLLVVFPAIALICALGVVEPLRLLFGGYPWVVRGVAVAAVAGIAVLHTTYYFDIHTEHFTYQHSTQTPEQEVAFQMRDAPPGTVVFFLSRQPARFGLDIMAKALNPGVTVFEAAFPQQRFGYVENIHFATNQVFVIEEGDKRMLADLERRFVLSPPVRWTNVYTPPHIRFVAYTAVGLR